MVPEGAMQAAKKGEPPIAVLSYDFYESQQWPAWHNLSRSTVVMLRSWWLQTAVELDLRPAQQEGDRAC